MNRSLLVLACLMPAGAFADEPPGIRHNPFARPHFDTAIGTNFTDLETVGPATIDLRITMVSSGERLAYVGGDVLRPGDVINGYTLAEVYEDRAIFTRADKPVTVYVKPDTANKEDLDD